eukprot:UN04518
MDLIIKRLKRNGKNVINYVFRIQPETRIRGDTFISCVAKELNKINKTNNIDSSLESVLDFLNKCKCTGILFVIVRPKNTECRFPESDGYSEIQTMTDIAGLLTRTSNVRILCALTSKSENYSNMKNRKF